MPAFHGQTADRNVCATIYYLYRPDWHSLFQHRSLFFAEAEDVIIRQE
jgi:predicted cupin superfamily sugar epimerase